VTAARDAGLAVERGEVVAVAANVLVRLEPGPIAARMSGATGSFRDSAESLAREVQLAAALSAAGAPVVAPLGGPYEACGLTVTLWPWVDTVPSGDAATAGRALRACHDSLLGVDATPVRLEPLGMLHEARRLAATGPADVALAVDHALEMLRGESNRIVHGDSHPGNVLWTADGPLWSDWEDAHLAPLEWDLACLVAHVQLRGDDFGWAETALRAHGGPYDGELLEVCVNARVAQGAAYLAFTGRGGPEALAERLAWLRRAARGGRGRPRGASRAARPGQ
jgi:phosphotransferase family enzyme